MSAFGKHCVGSGVSRTFAACGCSFPLWHSRRPALAPRRRSRLLFSERGPAWDSTPDHRRLVHRRPNCRAEVIDKKLADFVTPWALAEHDAIEVEHRRYRPGLQARWDLPPGTWHRRAATSAWSKRLGTSCIRCGQSVDERRARSDLFELVRIRANVSR